MKSDKKISVVMCTYNGEKHIKKQIDSIISQTYKNLEILILDDKSEDTTSNILKEYEKKYSFIKVIRNEKRLGVIKNFEKGIKLCKGEFIALSDQDDIWHPEKLEKEINALFAYDSPAMVHSDLEVVDENGKKVYESFFKWKGYSFPKEKAVDILISRSGVMGNTVMFNKALKEKILPFYPDIPMHDYYIGVINEIFGKRITLKQPLVKYRIHNSNTANRRKTLSEKIKSFFNEPLPYADRRNFLKHLLLRDDIPETDKTEIEKFLKCIDGLCYNERYHKNKLSYRIKFYIRRMLSERKNEKN